MTIEIRTRIAGIVNLTPDSFSDGGSFSDVGFALAHMEKLVEDGADILDIGAESTRPSAQVLTAEEEWKRLEPVLSAARSRFSQTVLSVDTRNAATARRALGEGVDWINDVCGGADAAMRDVIARTTCKYVVMHALSVPADPTRVLPEGVDAVQVVHNWAEETIERLVASGIAKDRIILDAGIGFGKTPSQCWGLLRGVERLQHDLPCRGCLGHSRKSFYGTVGDGTAAARDAETQMVSAYLAARGASYLRVHDVAGTKRAITVGKHLYHEEQP